MLGLGQKLSFTAVGHDNDLPANMLTYSLISPPAGATIDSTTGAFNWAPRQIGLFTLRVRVSDGQAFAEQLVRVMVLPSNPAQSIQLAPKVESAAPMNSQATSFSSPAPLFVAKVERSSEGAKQLVIYQLPTGTSKIRIFSGLTPESLDARANDLLLSIDNVPVR